MKKLVTILLYVVIFLMIDFLLIFAMLSTDSNANTAIIPTVIAFFGSKFITPLIINKIY